MTQVTVIATFRARAGKEREARAALLSLVAPTRAEAGCLNYDLHVLDGDPRRFLFHENWRSKADLDRHLATPHLAAVRARVAELFDQGPDIQLWTRVD